MPDSNAGNITVINSVPAGVAPAGSALEINCGEATTLLVQVTGTYTGALSLQGTVDGVTWVTITQASSFLNIATAALAATIASAAQGIFAAGCSGFAKVRITALAAVTGTAVVSIRTVSGDPFLTPILPLPAGAATIGNVGLVAGAANVGNTGVAANTSVVPSNATLGATTSATVVKASAGTVFGVDILNNTAAIVYLKLYDKATAPTVGTDIPVVVIAVPIGGFASHTLGGMAGRRFSAGISYAVTTGVADTDTAAPTAGVKLGVTYL
jgi:hypothetical protein